MPPRKARVASTPSDYSEQKADVSMQEQNDAAEEAKDEVEDVSMAVSTPYSGGKWLGGTEC